LEILGVEFEASGRKLYRHIPRRALPIHMFTHFYRRMYHLATLHNSVTDRWHYDADSWS